ncbi:MAG: porin [Verrucomicrobiaceae bacterium]
MNKLIQTIGAGLAATTVSALAGDLSIPAPAPAPSNGGDWCDTLEDLGKLYKDKKNPFIQEVKVFGRAQYQFGYTDGTYNGRDFSGDGGEMRRLRIGSSVKFLDGFTLLGRANLEKGGFRDDSFGYGGMDELYLDYDFGDVAGFEDVTVGYGRYKIAIGGEEHESSKKIKTVERSNLANLFAPSRSTGVMISAERNKVDYTLGIFSTDNSSALGNWDEGNAIYASVDFKAGGGDVILDFLYNDADAADEDSFNSVEWVASATYETEIGNWDLMTSATYGELSRAGGYNAYGIVIMPSTFLIEDKLEAVFRYQWGHASDGNGFQINSRNVRNVASREVPGVGVGRGDDNHTFYAGLNYYLCDHNAKVMTGVEYETLDGTAVDLEATTLWAAFRMYF